LGGVPNSRPLGLAVLFGGRSEEHEISLRSARAVIPHLDPRRFRVRLVGVTRQGGWLSQAGSAELLEGRAPAEGGGPPCLPAGTECVLPIMHGPCGEDGSLQGWLELLGVPFVGSDCTGAALAMDKSLAKHVLRSHGVPVMPWSDLERSDWERNADDWTARLIRERGLPCFVKPARLGSSVGITRAATAAELRAALDEAFRHGEYALVENAAASPREIEIAVLDGDPPVVSLPGEVRVSAEGSGWYDYANKYENDSAELHVPARDLSPRFAEHLRELALTAFRALRMGGLARVDFLIDSKSGRFALNEVNAIPGFTSISMYPRLMAHNGIGMGELCERLIAAALRRAAGRTAGIPAAPALAPRPIQAVG
jgi:D-alanine-D-alanine ligase